MGALTLVAGLYALLAGFAFVGQRAMMFPAPREQLEPAFPDTTLERVPASTGRTVYALHAPAPPGAPTVVHFHGNGESLAHMGWLVARFRAAGLGFYGVEYPGYGLAADYTPTERAILADAAGALQYLHRQLGVPPERTVLQGQSLGSGVAAEMARRGLGARLILVSPYTSMIDVAQRIAPLLPMHWIVRDKFDTARIAADIRIPTLLVHGARDELIPPTMSQRLVELFPDCRLVLLEQANHNDVFTAGGPELIAELARFAHGTAR
jgi:hypothetical protein